jgi:hypothetical protein
LPPAISVILRQRPYVNGTPYTYKKRDYQATGFLRIALLCDETTSVRHTWSEGKRKKKIDESLGEVWLESNRWCSR